jgi:hypothetical protein
MNVNELKLGEIMDFCNQRNGKCNGCRFYETLESKDIYGNVNGKHFRRCTFDVYEGYIPTRFEEIEPKELLLCEDSDIAIGEMAWVCHRQKGCSSCMLRDKKDIPWDIVGKYAYCICEDSPKKWRINTNFFKKYDGERYRRDQDFFNSIVIKEKK